MVARLLPNFFIDVGDAVEITHDEPRAYDVRLQALKSVEEVLSTFLIASTIYK